MNSEEQKRYWIKQDDNICVLCGSDLKSCHLGDYCSNRKCSYVDGAAMLTDKQAEMFKEFLIL